jgi:hypothetical protein
VQEDPNMEVPDGYKKVEQKEMIYKYGIPQYFDVEEKHTVTLEVLDDLMSELFGYEFVFNTLDFISLNLSQKWL